MNDEHQRKDTLKRRYMTSIFVQLTIGVLIVVGLFFYNQKQTVKIKRQVLRSNIQIERKPSLDLILEWRNDLALTEKQLKILENLKEEEVNALASLDKEIQISMKKAKQTIEKESQKKKRLSLADVTKIANPATELGKSRRELVTSYNKKALNILTALQLKNARQKFESSISKESDGNEIK